MAVYDTDPDPRRQRMTATEYLVRYPSGAKFTVTGRFGVVGGPHGPIPAVDTDDQVFVLDPRAIVFAAGTRVYGPRDLAPDEHDPAMLAWLLDHPRWDR